MTRLKTGATIVALTASLAATPLFANEEMREMADQLMNEYGFEVDSTLLTDEQLAEFQALGDIEERPRAAAVNRIQGILEVNPDTVVYTSGVVVEWTTEERDQLVSNADQVMNDYGIDADASALTEEQLAQIYFHDFTEGTRAEHVNYIQGVLEGS